MHEPLTDKEALDWSNTHFKTISNDNISKIKNINTELRTKYMNRSDLYQPFDDLKNLDNEFVTAAADDVVLYGNFTPRDFGIDSNYFIKNSTKVYDSMLKDTQFGIDYGYFWGSLSPSKLDSSEKEYIQVKLIVPKGTEMPRVGDILDSYFILPRDSTLKYIGKNFDKNSKNITISAELVNQNELTQATTTAQSDLNNQLEYQYQSPNQFVKLTPLGLNAGYVLNESSNIVPKVFESLEEGGIYSKDLFKDEVFQLTSGTLVHTDIFNERTQNDTIDEKINEFKQQYNEGTVGETTRRSSGTYETVATLSHLTPKDNLPQINESERAAATLLHEAFHFLLYSRENFKNTPFLKENNKTFKDEAESLKAQEGNSLTLLLQDPYGEDSWTEYSCEAFMAKFHPNKEISDEFKKQVPKTNRLFDNLFDVTPPTVPTKLKEVEVTGHSATLSFDHSSDEVGVDKYNIYVNGKFAKTVDTKKDVNGLSYPMPGDHQENPEVTIDNLDQITNYDLQVTAVDEAKNESAKSEVLKVTTKDVEPPQQQCCLTVQALVSNVARLIWPQPTDNHDVAEVLICRSESPTPPPLFHSFTLLQDEQVFKVSGNVNYYTDTTIEKGKSYTYYTIAIDSAGNESQESNKVTITTSDKDDEKRNEDKAENISYSNANINRSGEFDGLSPAGTATSSQVNLTGASNQFVVVPVDNNGNPLGNGFQISVDAVDHSAINTKDSDIYVGQQWKKENNFVSATDEDGKSVPLDDDRVIVKGAVDTSKPNTYKVIYSFRGKGKKVESTATITVKENKASLKTKDLTLYVGQPWKREDNFGSATDEEGNSIPYSDNRILVNETNIDISKPSGPTSYHYTYHGLDKPIDSYFTVTVKENKASIQTEDLYFYQKEKWNSNLSAAFVAATDESGQPVPFSDHRITLLYHI